ncbi:MAG: hypothetical protein NXI21_01735 [Alphaproteobacteria bacterium]|nr:hypothetical protein [Alphaproteobacteria bacterium]
MTLPVFPADLGIEQVGDFHLLHATEAFPSALTRAERLRADLTPRWTVELELAEMLEPEWRRWTAFVYALAGASGLFHYSPTHALRPQLGLPGGAPVVAGAGQTGRTLATGGWPAGQTVLKAGDLFHFDTDKGRELKALTEDAVSDGAGAATLAFAPPIRRAPADGAALILDAPSCAMRAVDDAQGALSIRKGQRVGRARFRIVESFVSAG